MTKLERAAQLWADTTTHYNCAQTVLIPFAEELGLTTEQANDLGTHFGGGMRMGATCGAVTGALMALGLLGADREQARAYRKAFQEELGAVDCSELLQISKEQGIPMKEHCGRLVMKSVELVEKYSN